MAPRVRIVRKRVSFASAVWRLDRLFLALAKAFWIHPQQMQERMQMEEARTALLRKQAEVAAKNMELAEMRKRKLMNELVLQDQKIEENNRRMGFDPHRNLDDQP